MNPPTQYSMGRKLMARAPAAMVGLLGMTAALRCRPAPHVSAQDSASARTASTRVPAATPRRIAPPAIADSLATHPSRLSERASGHCRIVTDHADAEVVLTRACHLASLSMQRQLGRPVPPGVVVQTDDSARAESVATSHTDEKWAMAIPADTALLSPLEIGAGHHISAEGYLAHEVAHRMAGAMLDAGTPGDSSDSAGYGTALPDWVDEALGLLAEPPADQRERLSLLYEGELVYALPLRRFLYMSHPALNGFSAGGALRRTFYSQSLAFAQFLESRAGPTALRTLIARLQAGSKQGAALTSLPGLPPDGGALEQAWLAWLRGRRAEILGYGLREPGRASVAGFSSCPSASVRPGDRSRQPGAFPL